MCAEEDFRCSVEAFAIHREGHSPAEALTQRVADRIVKYPVTV